MTNVYFKNEDDLYAFQNGLHMTNAGNTLLINRGNGTFVERASEYGVALGHWGWAGNLVDLDNDGDLDLIHTTKNTLRLNSKGTISRAASEPPALWVRVNASSFERVNGSAAGLADSNGRGMVTFDYDRDGDMDVLVADTSDPFDLYENEHANEQSAVTVELLPTEGQPVLGSTVKIEANSEVRTATYDSGSNFFSQSPRTLHLGLGDAEHVDSITVTWPDGSETTVNDVPADLAVVVSRNGTTHTRPFAGGS